MKNNLLKLSYKTLLQTLSDGKYHSGSILGKKFKLTRGAIWELIKQLKKLGINIQAKTNLGYRIPGGLELLDKKLIHQYAKNFALNELAIFDELPSTNSYLAELIKTKKNNINVCLAEQQTAGRGRLGRTWVSPFAQNIYLSLAGKFSCGPHELSGLSLAVAVAVVEALTKYGIKSGLAVKWPNDILWKDLKLAGILIDLFGETNYIYNAIIGIGLNVNMSKEIGKKIDQPWCDVAQITHSTPKRNQLVGLLLNQLSAAINLYQNSGLQPFIKKWQKLDTTYGKKVSVYTPMQKISGLALGINSQGYFLLKDQSGKIHTFAAGEVSLHQKPSGIILTSVVTTKSL
jgi:BirA family transcriptional regulator, biotin operon repressor / biotin---[acetyl-CoA-carboxylase] ligase